MKKCDGGYYCIDFSSAVTGPCDAGYYCVGGASISNPNDLATQKGTTCPSG